MEPKEAKLDTVVTKIDTLTKAIQALATKIEKGNGTGKRQKGK
jgi:hypothetical protein